MTYVFDLDGTLIDSSDRHWMLMKELLGNHGILVDNQFATKFMNYKRNGKSGLKFLINILDISCDIARKINDEWIEQIEDERWLQFDSLFADTIPTLKEIKDNILFLTLRNNKEGLLKELNALKINSYPVRVLSHSERKAEVLKLISEDVIMVGDTEIDYQAAVDVGCRYYLLNRGFRSKEYWESQGITSYDDLNGLPL